jgi:sulfate/thiosulfate transport system permease protein
MSKIKTTHILPGFSFTFSYTVIYFSLIVLIPLIAIFLKSTTLTWEQFWSVITTPRVIASYKLSFGISMIAGFINVFFGLILAWVLVRYTFPGKKIVNTLIDLPFALPTSVAGIALTAIYAGNGWIGQLLANWNIKIAFTPWGILIALTFIGLPFIVRTVQPVLEDLDLELEEVAVSLGANRWQTLRHVVLPSVTPALFTGFALAFSRGIGEYGSVIFIAGNVPMISEITPLVIITKLEQYDHVSACAIAVVMLTISFVLLLGINSLQAWITSRRARINNEY